MQQVYKYCDNILTQPKTRGGLFYDQNLSQWASNRYAANAACTLAIFASYLPENDSKRKSYIDFVKSQIDYMLGDNPMGVNYVVGAEENSPKAVHHRGASGTYDSTDKNAKRDLYTLYGALAGDPGKDDSYKDTRDNYQINEVALDYNAGFTVDLAALVHFGLGKEDAEETINFDRACPTKAPIPDLNVIFEGDVMKVSSESEMLSNAWCVSFKTDSNIEFVMDSYGLKLEKREKVIS